MNDWTPAIGDEFQAEIEELNVHDRYAVVVKVNDNIVGHVPREFSKIFYHFIRNSGNVTGEVCGSRKRSTVHMKGLEVPCIYKFEISDPKRQRNWNDY